MRIAVASTGKHENTLVSPVSGRAEYYLLFEGKKLIKAIKNPFKIGGGGAGLSVAQMLANERVELVISGKFGANMQTMLESKNIKIKIENNKTIKEIIEEVTKEI
ncbi:hypothetical protein KY348_06240 [Candidatus Woesearchaeota archaeon]|nr:hypothetical protein [Candidatus Woesearchaeota archaeon]